MRTRSAEPAQQPLALPLRGGKRPGAGRKSSRARPAVPHVERDTVRPNQPVHVTLRFARGVWNLRSERSFAVIHGALTEARRRSDARVVHFSVQGNHIHLIVEAAGTAALSNAVRALSIRLARRLNRMMGRSGPVKLLPQRLGGEGRLHGRSEEGSSSTARPTVPPTER